MGHPEGAPVVVLDLDGVVWLAGDVLPGVADAVSRLRQAGLAVAFLTNNSSEPESNYVERLEAAGIATEPGEVLTSAMTAAELLARELPAGSRVLACSGEGVVEALASRGLEPVDDWPCEAVVVGFHRNFDYDRLTRASTAIRKGAWFVATNTDPTYPARDGLIPGSGALVAAVATAAGCEPEVAGKPEAPTVAMVKERYGDRGVVVGDRPSTDGALAAALGWPFALVVSDATLSGDEPSDRSADFVGSNLATLTDSLVAALTSDGDRQAGRSRTGDQR
jgi:HAD superfamily hydrolase (TIGR01450 family)